MSLAAALVCVLAPYVHAEDDAVVRAARVYVKAAQEARKAGRRRPRSRPRSRPPRCGRTTAASSSSWPRPTPRPAGRRGDGVAAGRGGHGVPVPHRRPRRAARLSGAAGVRRRPGRARAQPAAEGDEHGRLHVRPRPGLVPEGLAYDAASDSFFVEQRARAADPEGRPVARSLTPFADRSAGLWAALGLAVDAPRRRLWVGHRRPARDGGRPARRRGAIRARGPRLDDRPRVVARYELPAGSAARARRRDRRRRPATSSRRTARHPPSIGCRPNGRALETIAAGEPFVSLQGLALSADGERLFVADYAKGDLRDRPRLAPRPPPGRAAHGGDPRDRRPVSRGRCRSSPSRTAPTPPRLLRLRRRGREASRRSRSSTPVIPRRPDPTLGVVVGDRFFYIGNSQWRAARPGGQMDPAVKPEDPVILGLVLR